MHSRETGRLASSTRIIMKELNFGVDNVHLGPTRGLQRPQP